MNKKALTYADADKVTDEVSLAQGSLADASLVPDGPQKRFPDCFRGLGGYGGLRTLFDVLF